nr:hypothetical protein [Paenibacillus xylanexedens]
MNNNLEQTQLLDYNHSTIQSLIRSRNWASLPVKEQILHVYNYVRDEIEFGYNRSDNIQLQKYCKTDTGSVIRKAFYSWRYSER